MDPHLAKKGGKVAQRGKGREDKKAREEEAAKCAKITDLFRTPRMVQNDEAGIPLSDYANGDDPEGEMQAELSARTELAVPADAEEVDKSRFRVQHKGNYN
ncbi:hypothetical protein NQZ68_036569 [Dissostichus eleginoides]|nr:hypothetical protein NQZ68_036569 [Dissostichus eleginoides]